MSELTPFMVSIPVLARSVAFSSAPTYSEYAAYLTDSPLLHQRLREVRLHPADQQFFTAYPDVLNMIAVVNDGAPDTAAILPIWQRIAILCPQADLRIVADEFMSATLDRLVDDEGAVDWETLDLPQLFLFDEEWQLQAQWGPRPQAMDVHLDEWLAAHPDYERLMESDDPSALRRFSELNDLLRLEMRVWCNSGMDRECAHEIRDLLAALQEEEDSTNGA